MPDLPESAAADAGAQRAAAAAAAVAGSPAPVSMPPHAAKATTNVKRQQYVIGGTPGGGWGRIRRFAVIRCVEGRARWDTGVGIWGARPFATSNAPPCLPLRFSAASPDVDAVNACGICHGASA